MVVPPYKYERTKYPFTAVFTMEQCPRFMSVCWQAYSRHWKIPRRMFQCLELSESVLDNDAEAAKIPELVRGSFLDVCYRKAFNDKTRGEVGMIIPVVITVYQDRSFTFITKTPPAAVLLKKAAKIAKGAGDPKRDRVGQVNRQQLEEIAKLKMVDLNANDLDAACKIIAGTARSMGIEVG